MSEHLTADERAARAVTLQGAFRNNLYLAEVLAGHFSSTFDAMQASDHVRTALAALLRDHEAGLYALALSDGPGESPGKRPVSEEREDSVRRFFSAANTDLESIVYRAARDLAFLLDHARSELDHRTAQLKHALAVVARLCKDIGVDLAEIDRARREGYRKGRAACVEAVNQADALLLGDCCKAVEAVPEEMP